MYIVTSSKNHQSGYYKVFETKTEAEKFLNTEEYDLSDEKRLNDFKLDWCYEPVEGETDEEVESKGYIWDENLQLFCMLTEA